MLTTVTRAVLAAAVGLTLAAAAAPASAQEADPTDVPQPSVVIRAISVCDGGKSGVEVILDDAQDPYTVVLTGSDLPPQETVFDEEHQVHKTRFAPVPVGDYVVEVKGAEQASDGAPVRVKACSDLTPTKYSLSVEVECRGGWGVATFVVSNPDTDEVRTYSLSITTPEDYLVELGPGMFLRITENLFDDGTHQAVLSGDALAEPIVEVFTVKCASDNQPSLFTRARCDDKEDLNSAAVVHVDITNPNRGAVDYLVTAGDVSREVTVPGASRETVDLGPFPGGEYPVTVIGSDGTETPTHVVVDHCEDVKPDGDGLQIAVRCAAGSPW
ncbi:hypothetical protein ACFQV2_05435 [Actinokineospora soli]|uniref:Uncharacterized protein n=1 Tax=Actinokineospora soli TaxID=1048753 RepID=A0ABW2TIA8_9PSEU